MIVLPLRKVMEKMFRLKAKRKQVLSGVEPYLLGIKVNRTFYSIYVLLIRKCKNLQVYLYKHGYILPHRSGVFLIPPHFVFTKSLSLSPS